MYSVAAPYSRRANLEMVWLSHTNKPLGAFCESLRGKFLKLN